MQELGIEFNDPRMLKFVGYYSGITHSLSHKALYMKDIHYRREIPVYFDEKIQNYQIKVEEFEAMVEKDISEGLIPFWCGTTLGSTSLGCNDPIPEIAKICNKHKIFCNVDAAWAGAALVVPEIREEMGKGLELVDAISINFGKWNMCGNNSAVYYVADKSNYRSSLLGGATPQYLKNKFTDEFDITDYKDWQVGLGRRFNSLRFWFMIRSLGVEGMRDNITSKVNLAKEFEAFVTKHSQFELICKRELSLVCFRLVKDKDGKEIPKDKINKVNERLLEMIEATNQYHLVSSKIDDKLFIRFVVCNHNTTSQNVQDLWKLFEEFTPKALAESSL